jgi:hypothetical protein
MKRKPATHAEVTKNLGNEPDFEKRRYPAFEEDYIREGLERAREQISRGETSNANIEELIEKARRYPTT